VNRLELTLSIGSFSAALGAVVAGIFGMNLRSTLENSVVGFWGTTLGILLCCLWVAYALFAYTRRRRIL
jgi:magnesium transporter